MKDATLENHSSLQKVNSWRSWRWSSQNQEEKEEKEVLGP